MTTRVRRDVWNKSVKELQRNVKQMNTSEQINELAAALSLAQGEMEAAKMNAVNPFLKNKYADLGSIIDAVKPALAANGLSFMQMPSPSNEQSFSVGLVTRLLHSSGQWIEQEFHMPIPDGKGINSAQQYGVALTYARRYALSSMLGIVADSDTDGSTGGGNQAKKRPQPPKKSPAPEAKNSLTDAQKSKADELHQVLIEGNDKKIRLICNYVVSLGIGYKAEAHALNALKTVKGKEEITYDEEVNGATAGRMFDWLIQRKLEA